MAINYVIGSSRPEVQSDALAVLQSDMQFTPDSIDLFVAVEKHHKRSFNQKFIYTIIFKQFVYTGKQEEEEEEGKKKKPRQILQ